MCPHRAARTECEGSSCRVVVVCRVTVRRLRGCPCRPSLTAPSRGSPSHKSGAHGCPCTACQRTAVLHCAAVPWSIVLSTTHCCPGCILHSSTKRLPVANSMALPPCQYPGHTHHKTHGPLNTLTKPPLTTPHRAGSSTWWCCRCSAPSSPLFQVPPPCWPPRAPTTRTGRSARRYMRGAAAVMRHTAVRLPPRSSRRRHSASWRQ